MLELEHSTGLRPTPGPILAPATMVSRSGIITLCCTPALSSSLARAAAWCGPTRMSRLLLTATSDQCLKKFHPKVRNHGEGPY